METIKLILRSKELRNGFLIIIGLVTIFRLAAHIPVPGIDSGSLESLINGNQFLGLLNLFSGGTLESFSIVALGLAPYITASVVFQLLGMIFPSVEELQKDEQGRQKMNAYTRLATIPLAIFQGFSLVALVNQQAGLAIVGLNLFFALISLTAGTVFLMWLGELISERKLGNGISLLIFAGIIAGVPSFVANYAATYTRADLIEVLVFLGLTVVTIGAVVAINEAQRNLPVQYARGGGGASGKVMSNLPLRVNLGGMIPILFALSLMSLPPLMAQFFVAARTEAVKEIAIFISELFANQLFYGIAYFLLVGIFTFFYASVVFRPEQISENLQKQGGFIPGIRPGKQTALYLTWVVNRILLAGAFFLASVAVLPIVVQGFTGNTNLVVGGASVIIIVSVVVDLIKQTQAQLSMRAYDV
ncbi:MAG: preprotein translocase subunit SecY [Patescibacteria group bacterium]